jgi:integrase
MYTRTRERPSARAGVPADVGTVDHSFARASDRALERAAERAVGQAPRRGYGHGSITRLPSGSFRVRAIVAGKRQTLGTRRTMEQAEALLFDHQRAFGRGAGAAATDGAVTLLAWGAAVLERRARQGYRAVSTERARWDRYVKTWPRARAPLSDIARRDVKAWLRTLTVGEATKRATLHLLRAVFREAVEDELLEANPCSEIRVRAEGQTRDTSTHLTRPELDRFLLALGERHRTLVAIAAGTGIRQGEMRSLLLEDVHLDDGAPRFVIRFGAPGLSTKSGKIRTVPLVGLALTAARAWFGGSPRRNPKRLAFPAPAGGVRPMGRMIARSAWKAALLRAGIERPVRWHDLRHTCATLLLQGSLTGRPWTLREVQELLGHASMATTERYAKATGTLVERAAREEWAATGHEPRLLGAAE